MAKMVSPAGDVEVKVLGLIRSGSDLVAIGQMGVWDAKIYLSPGEIFRIARLALKPSLLGYLIALPFIHLSSKSKSKRES